MTRTVMSRLRLPAVLLVCGCAGCASFDQSALAANPRPMKFAALGQSPEPPTLWDKILIASGIKEKETSPYKRPTVPPEAHRAMEKAQAFFDDEKYEQAEDLADDLAKEYENSLLAEEAIFLEAKAQFAQKDYPACQDTYALLFKKFPTTRYMETATKQLFEIARYWLRFPDVVTSEEIEPANFEIPSLSPLPKPKERPFELTRAVPILPNFTDSTRPLFDTEGRALKALKTIWLNDPTGPLADDAVMLTASHHLREGNYLEADRYYEILREEYPKSPHLRDAFIIGGHAKLMSYQGAVYDNTALQEAKRLRESTLRLFPKGPAHERIKRELKKIEKMKADRAWARVEFYQAKGRETAIAMSCYMVLLNYPDSQYASRARQIIKSFPPEVTRRLPPLPASSKPKPKPEPDSQPKPESQPPELEPVPYEEEPFAQ